MMAHAVEALSVANDVQVVSAILRMICHDVKTKRDRGFFSLHVSLR
jgi:hypothetical protein